MLDKTEDQSGAVALDTILDDKVECFREILSDVQTDIDARRGLSSSLTQRTYQHYQYIKSALLELSTWPIDGNRAIESRRSNLEKQLDGLKQEARTEAATCWTDVAALKKEWRTWFKQYQDLMQRVSLIGGTR